VTRAGRFIGVGAGGFAVQALTLHGLAAAGLPYPVATALAVEAAIIHNFLWHERWTWGDRVAGPKARSHDYPAGLNPGGHHRVARFLRFNGSTAVISIAGNVALMALFVGVCGLPLLPANLLSVLALSALNFLSADRFVFSPSPRQPTRPAPAQLATFLAERRADLTPL
jgi:putative flippase GtrA